MSKKTASQLDAEIAATLAKRPTYWRIQHMADPISSEWRSQIGHADEDLGTEEGTRACTSLNETSCYGGPVALTGEDQLFSVHGD